MMTTTANELADKIKTWREDDDHPEPYGYACDLLNDEIEPFLRTAEAVLAAARTFVFECETWEAFQELKTSISTSIPVEFMALCEAVEGAYGAPNFQEEDNA